MIYRVIKGFDSPIPFNTYKEAQDHVNKNGGQIYILEASCEFKKN